MDLAIPRRHFDNERWQGGDRVVTPGMSRELVEAARVRGARVFRDEAFAHPFMDRDRSVHRRRMQVIEEFLLR